jgi:hypothetical protein
MNKYMSERGAGEITAQQYVMEQFLILLAAQKHSALPNYFWKLPEYQQLWKRHVRSINTRIKEYGEIPIIRALEDSKLKNLRTFDKASAWLWKPVLEKYKRAYELEQKTLKEEVLVEEINPLDRVDFIKHNSLQQLRDLDNYA